jgi:hypothetical protein
MRSMLVILMMIDDDMRFFVVFCCDRAACAAGPDKDLAAVSGGLAGGAAPRSMTRCDQCDLASLFQINRVGQIASTVAVRD